MSQATYLLSTGRVSTQSLCRQIAQSDFGGIVEHEPLKAAYRPRIAFRNPRGCEALLNRHDVLKTKFADVEALMAAGRPYLSVGWTTYAWADFLAARLGDRVRFVGLVRLPFAFAASLLTHGFFAGRRDLYQRAAVIHAEDPRVIHKAVAAEAAFFSPYERCLFHWLEVNRYILEICRRTGGPVHRYEEVYGGGAGSVGAFLTELAGRPLDAVPTHFDRHQLPLTHEITEPSARLLAACQELCGELGYEDRTIGAAVADIPALAARYAAARPPYR